MRNAAVYFVKKQLGYVLYNWIMMFLAVVFIFYSLLLIVLSKIGKFHIFVGQLVCCFFLYLMFKLDLPDRFAFLTEVPKLEKKIDRMEMNGVNDDETVTICDEYIISEWEPGFLDDQMVLVYDRNDSLKNISDCKKEISEGRLYILYRAKACFYLCILHR